MRLKLKRREGLFIGVLVVAAGFALWQQLGGLGSPAAGRSRSRPEAPLPPVPRIDLARLDSPRADVEVGQRDLFDYGPLQPVSYEPVVESTPAPTPRPVLRPAGGPAGGAVRSARTSLPPLNLKFIGSVGNEEGVKVAVLVTDKNEILTGQPGEVVANRYRIARIGIESVDLEDVGTGQSRRIPLKGN